MGNNRLQAIVMQLKKTLKTKDVVLISTASKVNSDDWAEIKEGLTRAGLVAVKPTNEKLLKILENSKFKLHHNLANGSVLLVSPNNRFNGSLKLFTGKIQPMSVKLHNKIYPMSWVAGSSSLNYSLSTLYSLGGKKTALKRLAKLSVTVTKKAAT